VDLRPEGGLDTGVHELLEGHPKVRREGERERGREGGKEGYPGPAAGRRAGHRRARVVIRPPEGR